MNGDPISHSNNNRRFLAWPDLGQTRKPPGPNWASPGPTLAQSTLNLLFSLHSGKLYHKKQLFSPFNLLISLSETPLQRELRQVCGKCVTEGHKQRDGSKM